MYLQWRFSEEEWAQLEEAASCAQVVKVEVDVNYSDHANRVLAAGFKKNKILREVTLLRVAEELVDSVERTLSMNTALTTVSVRSSRLASSVLAAGFKKNKVVREVTLSYVPKKLVESVKRTLSMNTALTTVVVKSSR